MVNRRQNVFAFLSQKISKSPECSHFKSEAEVHTCWKRTRMDLFHILKCLSSITTTELAWCILRRQDSQKSREKQPNFYPLPIISLIQQPDVFCVIAAKWMPGRENSVWWSHFALWSVVLLFYFTFLWSGESMLLMLADVAMQVWGCHDVRNSTWQNGNNCPTGESACVLLNFEVV